MSSELDKLIRAAYAAADHPDHSVARAELKAAVAAYRIRSIMVAKLEDREGDTWTLRDNGYWSLLDPVGGWTRDGIEECYGPLTEVSDGR
jgi:hypothetical protein